VKEKEVTSDLPSFSQDPEAWFEFIAGGDENVEKIIASIEAEN